ncbi:MAG TPA: complex I NDUFA9 subunit family protein [Xanthomonadales bacterium]|nr:complex I NDUFA9 subunit family protein [Xanthomonadales bacterium]
MRIVLLGATGFVGEHLLPELSRRGHDCVVLARSPNRCRDLRLIPGVEIRQSLSLSPDKLAPLLEGVDAAINLVGILNERGFGGRGFYRAHVKTVQNLLDACQAAGVRRVVQISALNAGKGESHYLASKGEAEALLRSSKFVDATILQPSVIFGDGDSFFNRFAALLRLMPVFFLACPSSRLQPVWVGDVVTAVGEVLDRQGTAGKTLELAGPRVYTLKQLVQWTARAIGRKRWVIGLPNLLSRMQAMVMDFVPGKPFSTDNYKSLQLDNISKNNALPNLGISPRSINAVVPGYLCGSSHQHRLDRWREDSSA